MPQALYKCFEVGIARGGPPLQPVQDLHVRQAEQPFEHSRLATLKCSAVHGPKATQQEIELQQATAAAPTQFIVLGITFAPSPACSGRG